VRRAAVASALVAGLVLGGPAARADVEIIRLVITFDQGRYTSDYRLEVADPDVEVTWRLEPHEDCGVFTADGFEAHWTHPHESQRGEPSLSSFPDDRFCADTAQQQGGHPGNVVVIVSDGTVTCTLTYTRGSEAGELDGDAAECEAPAEETTTTAVDEDDVDEQTDDGGGGGGFPFVALVVGVAVIAVIATVVRRITGNRDVVAIAEDIVTADVVTTTYIERIGKEA